MVRPLLNHKRQLPARELATEPTHLNNVIRHKSRTTDRQQSNNQYNTILSIKSVNNSSVSLDYAKKSFYRAFTAVFGKVGRVASDNVVAELLKTKCLPILLYGLEACPLTKTQLKSLNYAVSSSFRKIFNASSNDIVYSCRHMFNFAEIENILCIKKRKFWQKYCLLDDIVCALCRNQADIELAS